MIMGQFTTVHSTTEIISNARQGVCTFSIFLPHLTAVSLTKPPRAGGAGVSARLISKLKLGRLVIHPRLLSKSTTELD